MYVCMYVCATPLLLARSFLLLRRSPLILGRSLLVCGEVVSQKIILKDSNISKMQYYHLAHVNYITVAVEPKQLFILWYNFKANILKWTLGAGWPENEVWYARCSVIPKLGDGLRLWPMQVGSGTWPSPCAQVYVTSGSFWNHKDPWFVPVISLNYEINMENSLCGGLTVGGVAPRLKRQDTTSRHGSILPPHCETWWFLLAKVTLTKFSLFMCSARQFVVEVDPRGLESGAHYAEVPLPTSDVIISSSKLQYGVHD